MIVRVPFVGLELGSISDEGGKDTDAVRRRVSLLETASEFFLSKLPGSLRCQCQHPVDCCGVSSNMVVAMVPVARRRG